MQEQAIWPALFLYWEFIRQECSCKAISCESIYSRLGRLRLRASSNSVVEGLSPVGESSTAGGAGDVFSKGGAGVGFSGAGGEGFSGTVAAGWLMIGATDTGGA